MKTKTLAILLAAAAVAGAAAIIATRNSNPTPAASTGAPALLFPELSARINDVASIEIKIPGKSFSLQRTQNQWGVASKNNFPAQLEQVKATVVGISQLKPLEPKTANPDLYSRIGVQDPGDTSNAEVLQADPNAPLPAADPTLVTLKDDKGAVLASLIIGTQRWGQTPSLFVRKAGDKQSWLAEGRLEVATDPLQWIDRQVLNLTRDRLRSVTIVHPADGSEVELSRASTAEPLLTLQNIPAGRELTAPTAPDAIATALQYLAIDDVLVAADVNFSEPVAVAVYRTFDGLVTTVRTVKQDAKDWIHLSFSYDDTAPSTPMPVTPELNPVQPTTPLKTPEEVKKEVEDLNARLSPWAFAVSEYKARNLTATLESLLKPAPITTTTPEAAPAPEGSQPE